MPLDPATYLLHTAAAEKTTVYVHLDEDTVEAYEALLIAQTRHQKLFITVEP
ncbi:hypothetical protein [Hymenobacter sp. APR13]|uniref:hypothetical protein n=1 Tax=Hymenobacter sp. APR13 TaxID=1356852 RepID=UPI0004E0974E|nr:hypothetical protein [Hymenobacter sp. APR13]AII53219.1 hypothetical protein N008_14695 [Hymenobacter sp. APR13]